MNITRYKMIVTFSICFSAMGCASKQVEVGDFKRLQAQVIDHQNRTDNLILLTTRMYNHLEELRYELCNVRFVVKPRTIQLAPKTGFPVPSHCTPTPYLSDSELRVFSSYLEEINKHAPQ